MAADHLLARGMNKIIDRPLLRFFTWKPYCISLGYHQNVSDINQKLCRQNNIDVVRRPTGGRAILHAEELTYSVIYPFNSLDAAQFYQLIHIPVVEVLKGLDIPAEFEPSQPDFRQIYKTDRAYVCFATSARYEVEIEGKKLIGSAQRIYENAILQHGSILLGTFHESLMDFLMLPEDKKKMMKEYIRNHTSSVWQYHPGIQADSLAGLLQKKYENFYRIQFLPFEKTEIFKNNLQTAIVNTELSIIKNHPSTGLPVGV